MLGPAVSLCVEQILCVATEAIAAATEIFSDKFLDLFARDNEDRRTKEVEEVEKVGKVEEPEEDESDAEEMKTKILLEILC